MKRLERDELYFGMTFLLAARGTCLRAKVGCVIVRDGRVVSTGYVGSPAGTPHCLDEGCITDSTGSCIRTVHAEANAIAFAAKVGIKLEGSTLYCTHRPCLSCAKLIVNAGIKEVKYLSRYGSEAGEQLLAAAGVHVKHEFFEYGAVLLNLRELLEIDL